MNSLKKILILGSAVILLILQGCSVTSVREHPTLEAQLETVDSVVIAPPQIDITMLTFSGSDEDMPDEERLIAAELIQIAAARLNDRGFDVVEFDFAAASAEDDEFSYALEQVREGYKAAKRTLYDTQMVPEADKRKLKSSVGEVANQIGDKTGADAVLLIEYTGTKDSPGKVAQETGTSVLIGVLSLGTVIAIPQFESSFTTIALIDTTTGDLLWSDFKGHVALDSTAVTSALESMPLDVDPLPVADDFPAAAPSQQMATEISDPEAN